LIGVLRRSSNASNPAGMALQQASELE
jgi:hypothetical protein